MLEEASNPDLKRPWKKEIPIKIGFFTMMAPLTAGKMIAALAESMSRPIDGEEKKTFMEAFRKEMEPLVKMWKTSSMPTPVRTLHEIKEEAQKIAEKGK